MYTGTCIGGYPLPHHEKLWGRLNPETGLYDVIKLDIGSEDLFVGDYEALGNQPCRIEAWRAVPPSRGTIESATCFVRGCGRMLECRASHHQEPLIEHNE